MSLNKNIILAILFFIIFNNINQSINPIIMTVILSFIVYILDNKNKEKFTNNINDLKKLYDDNNTNLTKNIEPNNNLGYPSVQQIVKDTTKLTNNNNCNCDDTAQKAIYNFLKERRIVDKKGLLHYADDYFADLGYSDIRWENYISDKSGGNGIYNSFDMGKYNILNTDRWAPPSRLPTSCKIENPSNVSPIATVGYPLDLQDFDNSRRILPKDNINIDYIKDQLNK